MSSGYSRIPWEVALALLCGISSSFAAEGDRSSEVAAAILRTSGVKGGLIVHLDCGQGRVTAALCAGDRYIVQGLDRDAKNVEAARRHIQSLGLYGKVSVRQWDSDRLPYGDNLVNLIVVTSDKWQVASEEIKRVLAPGGAAVTLDPRLSILDSFRKPWPDEIDQWTHYLHDSGNNAVAQDDRVGPPKHLQWKSGPMWSRSHEFASSVQALVSANGRLIGVIDEGIIGQPRGVPALWTLMARDAFNGILLWRQPCDRINPHALAAVGELQSLS